MYPQELLGLPVGLEPTQIRVRLVNRLSLQLLERGCLDSHNNPNNQLDLAVLVSHPSMILPIDINM